MKLCLAADVALALLKHAAEHLAHADVPLCIAEGLGVSELTALRKLGVSEGLRPITCVAVLSGRLSLAPVPG